MHGGQSHKGERKRSHWGSSGSLPPTVCGKVEGMSRSPIKATRTRKCWCGCGEDTDSYVRPGHDRKAEQALLKIVHGANSTADVLAMLGYTPENGVTNAREKLAPCRQ